MLRAALALADAEGIEALSMRRLAKELGVEAMSLYNHVANKDEILDGIIDLVAGEFELPSDGRRLEDRHARARDLCARGAPAPSLGDPASGCARAVAPRDSETATGCSERFAKRGSRRT